jgi:NAD(P)-dependent dehydrogenase (short-subunit alcohol dehydrogenase family)
MESGDGVALVTGGAGGIGLACARRLGRERHVVLADIPSPALDAAIESLAGEGIAATAHAGDISDPQSVAALGQTAGELGGIGSLVNAAGVSAHSVPDGDRIIAINFVGAALLLDVALPLMIDGGTGICLGSIGALRPHLVTPYGEALLDPGAPDLLRKLNAVDPLADRPGSAYAVAKHGVIQMCEVRALAWGQRGARLLSVSPGMIAGTGMTAGAHPDGRSIHVENSALGRGGNVEEIASVVEFLCSPDASYITGCDVRVDGGAGAGLRHHASRETRELWDPV